jgi:hypothetical protein
MRAEIGPVGTDSAAAWIAYGRQVVEHMSRSPDVSVPASALRWFSELLDDFARTVRLAAPAGRDFHWVGERSPEEAEFVMKALFEVGLAVEREHEAGRLPLRPPEADEFHVMMVRQVLGDLEMQGPAHQQFVDGLRAEWGVAGES